MCESAINAVRGVGVAGLVTLEAEAFVHLQWPRPSATWCHSLTPPTLIYSLQVPVVTRLVPVLLAVLLVVLLAAYRLLTRLTLIVRWWCDDERLRGS